MVPGIICEGGISKSYQSWVLNDWVSVSLSLGRVSSKLACCDIAAVATTLHHLRLENLASHLLDGLLGEELERL